jgi:coenzyme F420-0:L-glutamate ligase/coenzyme F420-1:gamma-L-glutamate ligase
MYTALEQRRTVRRYQGRPVEEEKLNRIARAAALAPSAHHTTPWHLTIIQDRTARERLARAMASAWDRDMAAEGVPAAVRAERVRRSVARFDGAPAMILASLDRRSVNPALAGHQAHCEEMMMIQSVAAAIYAVLLAAAFEGLGAAWQCPPLFCPGDVREVLGLPAFLVPQGVITLGYAESEPPPRPPRAVDEAISWIRAGT